MDKIGKSGGSMSANAGIFYKYIYYYFLFYFFIIGSQSREYYEQGSSRNKIEFSKSRE